MRLLLDTHALIWILRGDRRVPAAVRSLADDANHAIYVSSISVYELWIKTQRGLIDIGMTPDQFARQMQEALQLRPLVVTWEHALEAAQLPSHHLDPFDRILVAQANKERLSIVSADTSLKKYVANVIW